MTSIDDITLLAYVDGELDAESARSVEQALQGDPRLQREVRRLRESATLIRAAVNEPVHGPPPRSLIKALDAALTIPPVREQRRRWLVAGGFAAMIAVSFGGGYLTGTLTPRKESNLAADADLMDDIVTYYAFYASFPSIAETERPDPSAMEKWLSRQMQQAIRIPDLRPQGYGFETARLLIYEDRPIAQIVYESSGRSRIALCVVSTEKSGMHSFELVHRRGFTMITWQRAGALYVVIGTVPEVQLREFSAAISAALLPA